MSEPIIYAMVHAPEGDILMKYEGMGIQVISDMLTAQDMTANILSESEYNAFLKTHKNAQSI